MYHKGCIACIPQKGRIRTYCPNLTHPACEHYPTRSSLHPAICTHRGHTHTPLHAQVTYTHTPHTHTHTPQYAKGTHTPRYTHTHTHPATRSVGPKTRALQTSDALLRSFTGVVKSALSERKRRPITLIPALGTKTPSSADRLPASSVLSTLPAF